MHRRGVGQLVWALVALVAVSAARAQVVRGTVEAESTHVAVSSALVSLLDASGVRVARTLTDDAGRFSLIAPRPGRYTVRAERIGHRAVSSAPFELAAGETLVRTIQTPTTAVLLPVVVVGRDRCAAREPVDPAAAAAWVEARTALGMTAVAQEQKRFRVDLVRYVRDLAPVTGTVTQEESHEESGVSSNPFRSAPAELLAEHGYVVVGEDSTDYFAPDANVLLSESFAAAHCFLPRAGDAAHPGLVGVAFQPIERRRQSDVKGVLWIDRASAELRALEFEYTALSVQAAGERLGGRVEFQRLPNDAWIVQRWYIRAPLLGRNKERRAGDIALTASGLALVGVREAGGEVRAVFDVDGRPLTRAAAATLAGTLFDSLAGAPLAGAAVSLARTNYRATSDSAGRFELTGLPEGAYTVTFAHPALDALGIAAPRRDVRLIRGATTETSLALPGRDAIFPALCPDSTSGRGGAIAGIVRDAKSGAPLRNADVAIEWERLGITGKTVRRQTMRSVLASDEAGGFRACGVPSETPVRLSAAHDGHASGRTSISLREGEVLIRELLIDPSAPAGDTALVAAVADTNGAPTVRTLGTVRVTGRGLAGSGFEQRRRRAHGIFLTADEIARRRPSSVTELLLRVPGAHIEQVVGRDGPQLMVRSVRGGGGVKLGAPPAGTSTKGHTIPGYSSGRTSDDPGAIVGDSVGSARRCEILVFVDGARVDGVSLDSEVRPEDVAAIEIYESPTNVPPQYAAQGAQCGAVLVWTKRRDGAGREPR